MIRLSLNGSYHLIAALILVELQIRCQLRELQLRLPVDILHLAERRGVAGLQGVELVERRRKHLYGPRIEVEVVALTGQQVTALRSLCNREGVVYRLQVLHPGG